MIHEGVGEQDLLAIMDGVVGAEPSQAGQEDRSAVTGTILVGRQMMGMIACGKDLGGTSLAGSVRVPC